MINVGLYGDSFCTESLGSEKHIAMQGFQHHWSKILEQKLNYNITNYGCSGSSIYEAYSYFLSNHEKYDKNIVVLTIQGRYYDSIKLSNYDPMHIVSLPHLDDIKNTRILNDDDIEILRDLQGWYNLSNHLYEKRISKLICQHMYELRPDTIFIRVTDERTETDNYPLYNIYRDQCYLLGFDPVKVDAGENQELISGHLTPEFNRLFSEYLISRIENDIWPEWGIPQDFRFEHKVTDYFNI